MIRQLRPSEDAFDTYVFSGVKQFDSIMLCEGRNDAEVIKGVAKKLGYGEVKSIAVTDCEGIKRLYVIAAAIVALMKISRKVKSIAIVTDADELSVKGRVESLINSLRARGFKERLVERLGNQVFKVLLHDVRVPIYVAVSGVEEYQWLRKHELEDHILKLLELEGKLNAQEVRDVKSAKNYLISEGYDAAELVKVSRKENIIKALNHLVALLNIIEKNPI